MLTMVAVTDVEAQWLHDWAARVALNVFQVVHVGIVLKDAAFMMYINGKGLRVFCQLQLWCNRLEIGSGEDLTLSFQYKLQYGLETCGNQYQHCRLAVTGARLGFVFGI